MNWKRELGRVAMVVTAAFLVLGCSSSDKEPTKPEDKKPEEKKPEGDAGKKAKAQMAACRADLRIIAAGIGCYEIDNGKRPASLAELKAPAIRATDPWGHDYVYKNPGVKNAAGYDLYSLGPDGQDGTADDVWKP
jgi:hypothetical protein